VLLFNLLIFNVSSKHSHRPACVCGLHLQAFCICVACMDGKIADRKGYEYVRKLVSAASNGLSGGAASSEAKASAAATAEGPAGAKMTTEVSDGILSAVG
jgi:hypothetical protein